MNTVITVSERSEIKKSGKGNAYFLVVDTDGVKYICFKSAQHPDYPVGAGVYSKITEREDKDATIELGVDGEKDTPEGKPSAKTFAPKPHEQDSRNNSFAQSYAKDIMCAYIGVGRFAKDTPQQISTNINKIADGLLPFLTSTRDIVERIGEEIERE